VANGLRGVGVVDKSAFLTRCRSMSVRVAETVGCVLGSVCGCYSHGVNTTNSVPRHARAKTRSRPAASVACLSCERRRHRRDAGLGRLAMKTGRFRGERRHSLTHSTALAVILRVPCRQYSIRWPFGDLVSARRCSVGANQLTGTLLKVLRNSVPFCYIYECPPVRAEHIRGYNAIQKMG